MTPQGGAAQTSIAVSVADQSHVGEVRRTVAAACHRAGLDETDTGRASIIATEAATNLLKHAGGGEIVVSAIGWTDVGGIQLLALDRGPGIPDVGRALADGHSTTGTVGTGLGAMRRQSSRFEVYTQPGRGTAILSQVWHGTRAAAGFEIGALSLPKPGEADCGDVWAFEPRGGGGRFVVADGLGHGIVAREAALSAVYAIRARPPGPARVLEDAHAAGRSTRGAAVAVAEVDNGAGEVRFAGFGNVAGVLVGPARPQNMVSMNGTTGQGLLKAREFTYRFTRGTLLVMSSDGLGTHWSLANYPGLALRHPGLVAGVLYRDHSRRRDDVTVVAARLEGPA
jgi:anti-sigma regulatory factor (Ser/Thr protein kinase)